MTTFSYGKIGAMTLSLVLMACSALAKGATVKGICWRYSVVNGAARIDNLNQLYTDDGEEPKGDLLRC